MAYAFVHLLAELARAGETFVEITANRPLPRPEYRVCVAALVGFVLFYRLEHLVHWSGHSRSWEKSGESVCDPVLLLHIGGFALYAGLISYPMVRSIEGQTVPVFLYGLAMGLHFLATGRSLHHEHGRLCDAFCFGAGAYAMLLLFV
ncbi:MAG: hypothetical protein ACM3VT_10730 [Solirubrobacterales bacterium]